MPDASGKHWYLVQCKPRQTNRALEHLQRQGYKCLLPQHQVERLHNGQLQMFLEPLFPGYLFIHLDSIEDNWLPIRSTRGVSQIVSFGGHAAIVPAPVVNALLRSRPSEKPALVMGDKVSINSPSLQQLDSIFLEHDGFGRVLLLLKILQREVVVKLPLKNIKRKIN